MNKDIFEYNKYKNSIKQISDSIIDEREKIGFSIQFCQDVINSFVFDVLGQYPKKFRQSNVLFEIYNDHCKSIASELGRILASKEFEQAGFYIGNLYTSLLPNNHRSKIGAYYTPPELVNRMISMLSEAGFDWYNSKIVDPACGGAAFLGSIAKFIIESNTERSQDNIINIINKNISGFEIDPFAAWISQTLLETFIKSYFNDNKIKVNNVIKVCNSLTIEQTEYEKYDLVIGNPPYGKVSLSNELKEKYQRSLYGHANLYGLFTDLALQLTKQGGYISFVTPTSFLGGQYFKNLRKTIRKDATLKNIDFIKDRGGVFSDVLQETALATFCKSESGKSTINEIVTKTNSDPIIVDYVGKVKISEEDSPWVIPRSLYQYRSFRKSLSMKKTLTDYGFIINTGQLVWNRHKPQLRKQRKKQNHLPLIWAESILPDGIFHYQATRKNHVPFIEVLDNQKHLITNEKAILVQRTTAKEQEKRIISAILPDSFLEVNKNGVVVENHINIIKKVFDSPLSFEGLNYLLNARVVDEVFRCVSGSVAVSAYELKSIPLPDLKDILELEELIKNDEDQNVIFDFVNRIYGAN